jgi:hypothetical protein
VTPAHVIAQGPPDPGLTFELLYLIRFTVFPPEDEEAPPRSRYTSRYCARSATSQLTNGYARIPTPI